MKKVWLPVMLVLAGLLAGCSSGSSSSSSTPTLISIAVTPASSSITVGLTQQFKAVGTYSNNTMQDLTATATWSSSTTAAATISSSGGLATAVAAGTTTIVASVSGNTLVTGSTTLTVTAVTPTLQSITVAPVAPSVAAGLTVQFTATGTYSDGSTQVLTSTAAWTSANTAVATIAAGGLATTLIQGTTTITATVGSVAGTTTLMVGPAVLESIAVMPANDSVPVGTLTQFTATGTYSDGSTQNLTATVTWTSSTASVATVAATGVVTALAVNAAPVTITATSGSIHGSTQLTVTNATLNSIAITGAPSVTIADLTSYKFSAFGSYNDGSKRNITSQVTWTSSLTSVATISASGVATALSAGATTITATSGTATASVTLVVTSATVTSIVVAPSNQTLEPGTTQPYTAVGNFSDGSSQTITQNVSWSSSKTTVATISNTSPNIGLATAVATGTTTISATFEGIIGSVSLHVNAGTLKSITLTPATAGMAVNSALSLQCVGKYSDGKTQHIEPFAVWTSSDTTVATVNGIGIVKGVAIGGPVTITCALGLVSATASITVEALAADGLAITPASPSVAAGTSISLVATGTLTDGSTQDLTSTVVWTSSDTTVATIGSGSTSAGVVSGIAAGTTTVTAAFSGQVAVTQVTVTSATLSSIIIAPPNPIIALGVPLQFVATGTFSDGSTENLLGQVAWTSSNNAVAIIDPTGAISTTGKGTTTITATLDGVSDTTVLTVN